MPTRACETVADAVLRLGNKNVAEIISGIVVFGMFSDVEGLGARVRDHSAGVAAVARVLAVEWRHDGAEHVFLSSLLHDVGKLLMMQAGAPRYELLPANVVHPWIGASIGGVVFGDTFRVATVGVVVDVLVGLSWELSHTVSFVFGTALRLLALDAFEADRVLRAEGFGVDGTLGMHVGVAISL